MIENAVLNDKNLEEYFLFTDDAKLIKYNKKYNSYKELKKNRKYKFQRRSYSF